jgi:hypothetical protein
MDGASSLEMIIACQPREVPTVSDLKRRGRGPALLRQRLLRYRIHYRSSLRVDGQVTRQDRMLSNQV